MGEDVSGDVSEHPLLAKIKAVGLSGSIPTETKESKPPTFDADLIPDIESEITDDGLGLYLDRIGIVEAYNRWADKGVTVPASGRTESIKVRCPNPNHPDRHPSAWLNTEIGPGGVGICRACGDLGFDKFTIFAWNTGLTTPGQSIGSEFPEVRRRMAQELGATITTVGGKSFVVHDDKHAEPSESVRGDPGEPGHSPVEAANAGGGDEGSVAVADDTEPRPHHPLLDNMRPLDRDSRAHRVLGIEPDDDDPDDNPDFGPDEPGPSPSPASDPKSEATPESNDPESEPVAPVVSIETGEELHFDPESLKGLQLDWESMVAPGTFLHSWMEELTYRTDIPHEYIFFNGLVALGAVAKRNVFFPEARFVYPNLMVLLFGDTSSGKSRSLDPLSKILDMVDPYNEDPTVLPQGTKKIGVFGSGESLIASLRKNIQDSMSGAVVETVGVSAFAKMEEFSLAVSMSRRTGSSFKEYLMSLYDTGYASHTSLASGDLTVSDAFLQVSSTTQPDAVFEFLRQSDAFSGFLNRWVVVSGENRLGYPLAVHPATADLFTQADMLTEVKEWAEEGHAMRLEGDALGAWTLFYTMATEQVQQSGSPLLARWDLTLKKIMLLLAANEMVDHPTEAIVRQVTDHIFPYMCKVYGILGVKITETESIRSFEEILEYIEKHYKRHGNWPTARDLRKSAPGKRYGAERVFAVCETAVRSGLLVKSVTSQTARYAMPLEST